MRLKWPEKAWKEKTYKIVLLHSRKGKSNCSLMKSRLNEERSNGGTGKDSKNKIGELSLKKDEK